MQQNKKNTMIQINAYFYPHLSHFIYFDTVDFAIPNLSTISFCFSASLLVAIFYILKNLLHYH